MAVLDFQKVHEWQVQSVEQYKADVHSKDPAVRKRALDESLARLFRAGIVDENGKLRKQFC
ncbi:hypothetical protein [Bifidobacterium leontopitheci]|uniref:hypothetical protein n=1 Tax=Bifidobacterium leontopitheci TaxID=2650774 RepID=UPI00126436E8|nr:hypothetical protein [Bifidobacterium leontopitheci]